MSSVLFKLGSSVVCVFVKCEKPPSTPSAIDNVQNNYFFSEGRLVEDMENKIRNTMNDIYFGKTNVFNVIYGLRSVQPLAEAAAEANSQAVLQVT